MSKPTELEQRRDYAAGTLTRKDLLDDPRAQFETWLQQAKDAKLIDATAMTLSTVDREQRPHARIVLLKAVTDSGYTFYTNQRSDKGLQLETNPNACLLFYWRELERQVRIRGTVSKLPPAEADAYFATRPLGSRLGASVSEQSRPVDNRAVLESAVASLQQRHPDGDIPRPEHWGGYCLSADYYEFWQGRPDRLHDRFSFGRQTGGWQLNRLSP